MNKTIRKVLSFVLVFMLFMGSIVPAMAAEEETEENKGEVVDDIVGSIKEDDLTEEKGVTTLTIHKLVADNYKNGIPFNHNGGELSETQLQKLGTNVKGLAGVTFAYFKVENEDKFKELVDNRDSNKYKIKEKVLEYLGLEVPTGEVTTNGDGSAEIEDLKEGNYWFVETERPTDITEAKAVPFGITLPLMNQIAVGSHKVGTVYLKNVHVYPKNVSQKPEMDKYFGNKIDGTESSKLTQEHILHPDYQKYLEEKELIDARIGSKVPFEVKTKLKQGQVYKTLSWSDIMTDGLEYDKDSLKMTISPQVEGNPTIEEVVQNGMGFDAKITDTKTINAINEKLKDGDVEITLTYTATVTKEAVVDMPESNTITFKPGEPKHNDNQTKPTNKEIKVEKTWEGDIPDNALVTYFLIDKNVQPAKTIAQVTLDRKGNIADKSLNEGIEVSVDENYTVTFKGLDDDHEYTIEEFADGYEAEYIDAKTIKNKPNPSVVTPRSPRVVVGGKKFVKTDTKESRLAGAEFVIKNREQKYLAAKSGEVIAADADAVKTAKNSLNEAIETYNKLTADEQRGDKGKEAKNTINSKQQAYNEAVAAAGTKYEWVDSKEKAIVFISDGEGRFEITGLGYGSYEIEEIKAPQGYAKLSATVTFDVDENSYKEEAEGIHYNPEGETKDALKVENKDLTIPQTGGIGTLIFGIVGVGLMVGAIVAMKKRNEAYES